MNKGRELNASAPGDLCDLARRELRGKNNARHAGLLKIYHAIGIVNGQAPTGPYGPVGVDLPGCPQGAQAVDDGILRPRAIEGSLRAELRI